MAQLSSPAVSSRVVLFASSISELLWVAWLGELWETVPIIPIWSPTIRSGYAPGVTGVEHEWGAVLDYTAIVAAP